MVSSVDASAWVEANTAALGDFRGAGFSSLEDEVDYDRPLLRMLHDAGLSRRGWPESVGGLGGDETDRARLYDALSWADIRLPEAFVLLETLGPVLVEFAPELAARHLPAFLRGEEVWAQGFSEPEAGSDLAAVRTRAALGTDSVRLTGQKVWNTLGQCADYALVLARSDPDAKPHRGLSMVWVDLASPGVKVRSIRASNGRNEFAEMFFSDVEVPLSNIVGGRGAGWAVAMYLLQFERGMYAWFRQVALHRNLRRALAGAGHPDRDASAAVGQAFTTLCALRSSLARTVRRLAAKDTLGPEASIDKVLLSRAEQQTHDALRVLAGPAFLLDDDERSRALRDDWFYSRAATIFGGAVEVQRTIVAERLLGLPREARGGR
jgi:alkylation response protein AidB-like acyl-CoA dehydrogenase